MKSARLTNTDGTPHIVQYVGEHGLEEIGSDSASLIRFAAQSLRFGEHSLFGVLPEAVDRIIERKAWREREPALADFGVLALHPSGLAITNDQGLALLRAALDIKGRHVEAWADVLAAVDAAVKTYAAGTKHSVSYLREHKAEFPDVLTYAPGNGSFDRRLLNLRSTDKVTFRQVVQGEKSINDVLRRPKTLGPANPLVRIKSAWRGASDAERRQFLSWLNEDEPSRDQT